MNGTRRTCMAVATMLLAAALGGCKPSADLVRPCCYNGDVALAHLADTRLTLEDGSTVAFGEAFPGFDTDSDSFGRVFPFRKADIGIGTFASLREVLPKHDANEDGILETPELTALYVTEAARGLGYPVVGIEPSGAGGAIATSRADESALVRFVERHLHEMAKPQQGIFRDLYWLGVEVEALPHFFILDFDDFDH